MLSFTSMSGGIERSVKDEGGPYSFRISEKNYHRIDSFTP